LRTSALQARPETGPPARDERHQPRSPAYHWSREGRAYYDRKIAEGETHKEALRSLKRRRYTQHQRTRSFLSKVL
jgi:hypothetical protein